jgi:hypothetical protein
MSVNDVTYLRLLMRPRLAEKSLRACYEMECGNSLTFIELLKAPFVVFVYYSLVRPFLSPSFVNQILKFLPQVI